MMRVEPNWQPSQEAPWQGQTGPRRPVYDGNSRAQRPLGVRDGEESRGTRPAPRPAYGAGGARYQPEQPPQYTGGYSGQNTGHGFQTGPRQTVNAQAAPAPQWTGPTPANPFEEPEEAPELRNARSDNLYNRDDHFWDHVEDVGVQPPQGTEAPAGAKRAEGHTVRWVILILAVLVVCGGLVYGAVFQVRSISVEGAGTISAEEVISLSGITLGMNTFSIDDDKVAQGVESNRYLSLVCVDKQLPDKVVIQVKERTQAAQIKYCGVLYTIDNRGMVLEESIDTDLVDDSLVSVEGLGIKNCRVGESLTLTSSEQLQVYTELMVEMKVMSALPYIKELDLSNMDNIFIVTTDGYTVRMGDTDQLHAKLRSLLLTRERLNSDGYQGGTIDVSAPVNPTYIPEG